MKTNIFFLLENLKQNNIESTYPRLNLHESNEIFFLFYCFETLISFVSEILSKTKLFNDPSQRIWLRQGWLYTDFEQRYIQQCNELIYMQQNKSLVSFGGYTFLKYLFNHE